MIVNGKSLLEKAPIREMNPFKLSRYGVSCGLSEAGYDIRLKQDVKFTGQMSPRIIICEPEYTFAPDIYGEVSYGRFCLASAMEEFQMPEDLVAIVHDKSTWARKGLSVFNTVIEPGWKGFLTLELVYHGSQDLHLPAGCGIAQVIFHQVTDPAAYKGKYQNQADEPVGAING